MKAATALSSGISFSSTISIHAAREGGDNLFGGRQTQRHVFQSTPPVKAATDFPCSFHPSACISIHAAREGGDEDGLDTTTISLISIHAAREGGDKFEVSSPMHEGISIHAAREGGDDFRLFVIVAVARFQSTPPVKAATTWWTT